MLAPEQKRLVSEELTEKYHLLGYDADRVTHETGIDADELRRIFAMSNPYPGNVWKLREYLDDMLRAEGNEIEWRALADPRDNRWFPYDTPWRASRRHTKWRTLR